MRKQFFFKSMLCLILGLVCNVAWAQPKKSDAPSNGQWADNTTWFVMSTLSGYLYGSEFADNAGLLQLNQTKTNKAGEHLLWSIVEGENGKYYIYNKAKGANVVLGFYDTTPSGDNRTYRATFVPKDDSNYTTLFEIVRSQKSTSNQEYWCLRAPGTTKYWNPQGYLTYWNSASATNDNGSAHMFVESDIVAGMEYEFTDNVGNSFTGTFTGMKSTTFVQPSYTGVDGAKLSNLSCTESKFSATISFPFPVSKEGGATNWRFIETAKVTERNTYISVRTSDNRIITRSTHASNGMSYLPIADLDEIKKWMWAFYPEFDNDKGIFSFKIKNAATGLYVPSSPRPTSSSKVQDNISVTTKQESGSFSWGTCIGSGKGFYCKDDSNIVFGANSTDPDDRGAMLWYKNGSHAGCNLNIILPRYYVNYSLTDNSGLKYTETCSVEYTPNTTGELAKPTPTLTGIPSNMISGATFENNTYTATVNLPFSTSDLTNERPTMIESFAPSYTTALFYWFTPNGTNIKVAKNVSPSPLNVTSYMWAIYPQLESGVMKFTIKHIASGKYVYTTSTGNAHGDNTVTLNSTATKFILGADGRLKKDGSTVYLSINTSSGDNGHEENLGTHSSEHEGTKLTYPEVSYNISVSEKNVASLTSPFAVTIPDGVVAKYVKAEDNEDIIDALTYAYLEGTIPANTPVIISAPVGNQTFVMADDASAVSGNILFSYNTETAVQGSGHESNVYSISIENDKVAFRPYSGENYVPGETYLDITGKFAEQAPSSLNIYDYIAYKTEIEGYDNTTISENPNTHLGTITLSSGACRIDNKLSSANVEASMESIKYWTGGFSIELTRKYRGYEFLGFWLGETELGLTPTLTAEQVNAINEANPIIAKYKPTDEVTLFYDDDEFSYRIPAIAKTSTGRLIAVSDYRHNLDDIGRDKHGTGKRRIDLVMRTSEDNGRTWSEKRPIIEGSGTPGSDNCAYGDAAIAVVGEKVLVMAAAGDVMFTNGNESTHNRTVRLLSENGGDTWADPVDISETLFIGSDATIQNGYCAFFGSGKLAVDEDFNGSGKARIYGAMLVKKSNGNYNNYVIFTDDLGLTWKILGGSQTRVADGDEPKVEILPSGQILLSARRGGGRKFNVFTYGSEATDKANGVGTWSGAADGCGNGGSNATNGEIMCIDAKKPDGTAVILLLQSQPKGGVDQYDRKDVTIWYKEITNQAYTTTQIKDGWTEGLQVSNQQSSYSAMTLQADGKIAFFFEEAPCYGDDYTKGYSMVYVPLTIDEITKGRYLASNTDFEAKKSISVTLTDAEGNVYKDVLTASLAGIGTALTTKYPFITLGNNVGINLVDESYTYTNTVALPFKVSNENGTYWHNIYYPCYVSSYPYYLCADNANDSYVSKHHYSANYGECELNTKANEDKISWAVYNVNNGLTFKFKNKLTGKYIAVTGVDTGTEKNVTFADEVNAQVFSIIIDLASYNGDYALESVYNGETGYVCSTSSNVNNATNYKGGDHPGKYLKITEAPNFDALIDEANAVLNLFGDGLGQYSNISGENLTAINAAKSAMENAGTVKLNTLNEYIGYTSKTTGATLNMPKSGQFFRIKNNGGSGYLSSGTGTGRTQFIANIGESASSIFYYDNGKLLAYENGLYLAKTNNFLHYTETLGAAAGVEFSFAESPARGKYLISFGGRSFYSGGTGESNAASSGQTGDNYRFTLEEVTSFPFTFKAAALGYATFHAPVAVELPVGVNAYIGKILDGNKLKMRKFDEGKIPANTAVLLYNSDYANTPEVSLSIIETTGYTQDVLDDIDDKDDFVGTVAAEDLNAEKNCYSLQKSTATDGDSKDKVGFFKKTSGTKAGFKAWIETDASNPARAFTIIFDGDDATGLKEALGLENENVEIYDLSGRRLDKPAKGVNVIGGKLVIK